MSRREIYVRKSDGTQELFDPEKLQVSLETSGATKVTAKHITEHVLKELEDGMSTSIIREHAFTLLDRMEKPASARYSLKKALSELGPSGFPFEQFAAEIFRARSFHVETNQFIEGHCTEHEVDLVVWNENKLIMIEAKFHNELGLKSDLKVALYVKARFDDLLHKDYFYGKKRKLDEGWLITNTKFTEKAISYSTCAGLRIIGWNYPAEGNLHDLITDSGLHPVTSISSLSLPQKRALIGMGIVLCRDVKNPAMLKQIGLDERKIAEVIEEANLISPSEQKRKAYPALSFN